MVTLSSVFQVSGRAGRREYWLVSAVVNAVFVGIFLIIAGRPPALALLPLAVIAMALLAANLAVGSRRMHDRDRRGSWVAISYLSQAALFQAGLVSFIRGRELSSLALEGSALAICIGTLFYLGALQGSRGPNRYGEDPLASRAQEAFA